MAGNDKNAEYLLEQKRLRKAEKMYAKKHKKLPLGLNITSLLDAMTILLVFLLITLTSDPLNIKMDDYLVLAKSNASLVPNIASVPITITKKHVIVDHKAVVTVHCKFQGRECTNNDIDQLVKCERYMDSCSAETYDIQSKLAGNMWQKEKVDADKHCSELEAKGESCTPKEFEALSTMTFYFDSTDKEDGDENKFLIVPLHEKLKEVVKLQKEQMFGNEKFKGITTIISDKNVSFRMISEIVYTAGMAELGEIRFAIVKRSTR